MPIVNAFPVRGGGFDLAVAEDDPILLFHNTVTKETITKATTTKVITTVKATTSPIKEELFMENSIS